MKLTGRQASDFLKKPNPKVALVLLYGGDPSRLADKRKELVAKITGPNADEEMRLTRLHASDVRKEPASLLDGVKAQGFFPGIRAVVLDDATDGMADVVSGALKDWQDGDAFVVVTAGSLAAKSKLRKLIEGSPLGAAIGIYDDPPTKDEILNMVSVAGIRNLSNEAQDDLLGLAREIEPAELRQTIEKLALYTYGSTEPVNSDDVVAVAPTTRDGAIDDALHCIADARAKDVGPVLKRLSAQGVNPTTLCIWANRHFRSLHSAASHPQGPDVAMSRARPPVFGPRRDKMVRQARAWGVSRIEKALTVLMDTDLTLRSAQLAPDMAVVERAFIRIAMLGPK